MTRSLFHPMLIVVVLFATTQAQTIWTQRSDGPQIRLEVLRPSIKSGAGVDFSSTIITLDGRVPITKGIAVQVEVPYTSEKISSPFFSESQSQVGNPYLGFEISSEGFPVFAELGFRPMLVTSQKSSVSFGAVFGDFERAEAYLEDLTTFQFALNVASPGRQGFVYRVKAGPTIWSPKGGGDATTLIDYGAKAGYDNGAISAYAGLTGRWNTEVKSGKSTYHFLGFDLGYRIDRFRPALFVHLPLDKELT
ncbi:MAG: hypothetical protein WBD36_03135, partial [Bacteroidota bacterium]